MGKVIEYLVKMIEKQVKEKGIVVWYDPEAAYTKVVQCLDLPKTKVLCFQDTFFDLRRQIEDHIEFLGDDDRPVDHCGVAPKLIIYLPFNRNKAHQALIECECAGTIMEPGAGFRENNTRLRGLAERIFSTIAPDQVESICQQVDEGLLTLAELDNLAEEVESVGSSVIKLIFEATAPETVLLLLAASDQYDAAIMAKKALPEIKAFVADTLGLDPSEANDPAALRDNLHTYLLLSDLLEAFSEKDRPEALSFISIAGQTEQVKRGRNICQTWRNRADLRETYILAANKVESRIGLKDIQLVTEETLPALLHKVSFSALEEQLMVFSGSRLLARDANTALSIAGKRENTFWSVQEPSYQLRWSIIANAARVLLSGQAIREKISAMGKSPEALADHYVDSENPWYLMDTYYRRLEHHYALFDIEPGAEHDLLQNVMALVRNDYTQTLEKEAEAFTMAMAAADFQVKNWLTQDAIFQRYIAPAVTKKTKVAYVLVDALRFEMGRELADGLQAEFDLTVDPALCLLPSITAVGMAALLPGSEQGLALTRTSGGKLAVTINDTVIKNRSDRLKYLQNQVTAEPYVCKLNQIIKPSPKVQKQIKDAPWVLVTSQELDRWGEEGEGEEEVRIFMEEVLSRLGIGIRRLKALGVEEIVVTADHGHLFGEAMEGGSRMDPPHAKNVELHGRAWIGSGGKSDDGYLRVTADQLGLGGEMELAFPRSLACFKCRGGTRAYCHGGLSFQEMIIPVIQIQAKETGEPFSTPEVELTMSAPAVTNRFFSVETMYEATGLFATDQIKKQEEEITVRIVVKAGQKEVGKPVMAAYGFDAATTNIQLTRGQSNSITLMLTATEAVSDITIYVLDAATEKEIGKQKKIPVDITI